MGDSKNYVIDLDGLSRFKNDLDLHNFYTPTVESIEISIDKDQEFRVTMPTSEIQNIIDSRPIGLILRYDNSDLLFHLMTAEEHEDGEDVSYILSLPMLDDDESGTLYLFMDFEHGDDKGSEFWEVGSDIKIVYNGEGGNIDYADTEEVDEMFEKEITYDLSNCSLTNEQRFITEGSGYYAEVNLPSGGYLSSVWIVMGGSDITNKVWNGTSVNIPMVTDNISMTFHAEVPATNYSITFGSVDPGVVIGNNSDSIESGQEYTNTLTIDKDYTSQGFHFGDVHITMNGDDYDYLLNRYDDNTRIELSGMYATGDIHWDTIYINTK